LNAVGFQLDQLPGGTVRFSCLLPTAQAGGPHRVEAQAATEAEAVRLVLDQASRWRQEH
jgi:hypothetical protein